MTYITKREREREKFVIMIILIFIITVNNNDKKIIDCLLIVCFVLFALIDFSIDFYIVIVIVAETCCFSFFSSFSLCMCMYVFGFSC